MSLARALARLAPGWSQRAPAMPVQSSDWGDFVSVRSAAGVNVSPTDALQLSTVQACVTLIARSLASVPLVLYRRTANGGRQPAENHPLYALLHDIANPLQTAFDVRQQLFVSALLYGNGYAEIEWGADGYPTALWPLPPEQVQLWATSDRQVVYRVSGDLFGVSAAVRWLPEWRVHHLRGLAVQGLLGLSPLRAANAVGLAMATEEFGARYFGDGAHPSIVLSHPAKLTPEATKNLRASFEAQWSGMSNAHRVAVVGEGVKPEAMRIAPNESQFLETRAFQVAEICRIFNVSPGLVGATETQTYASAEQDLIRFRELTLKPWADNHAAAILHDCLLPDERGEYFADYVLSDLQMTDLKTRYEAHQIGILTGFVAPNEARAIENMNPLPGGDDLLVPLNMGKAKEGSGDTGEGSGVTRHESGVTEDEDSQAEDSQDDARAALIEQAQVAADLTAAWVADVRTRLAARIANDVRQAGAKALRTGGRTGLSEWGETMIHEWRTAGDGMLAALHSVRPGAEPNVGEWVATAYQAAVRELIHE